MEMNKIHNIAINHKKVLKLMRELGFKGKVKKNKYKSYKGEVGKIHPNIINRDFNTSKPNEKWVTDVSEFRIGEDKVYLSPILDLHTREIISYTVSNNPNLHQVREMIKQALPLLKANEQLIFHSDQGWHYQHKVIQSILKENGIIQSMSRKGNCLDNSVMENFFGRMKVEMFYGEVFSNVNELTDEIHEYIYYYNNFRITKGLKGLTPIQYRNQSSLV